MVSRSSSRAFKPSPVIQTEKVQSLEKKESNNYSDYFDQKSEEEKRDLSSEEESPRPSTPVKSFKGSSLTDSHKDQI